MKPHSSLLAYALVAMLGTSLIGRPAHARTVTVDLSACSKMGAVLTAMHAGAPRDSIKVALDRVLDTPSYRTMFQHYNRSWRPHHLPPDVFERMILSLAYPNEYSVGENTRADSMLVRWRAAYADLPGYQLRLRQIEAVGLTHLVDRGVKYAQGWLPKGWEIPDFTLVVQPQGGSPAYSIDDAQGYDFLQLPTMASGALDIEWLVGTIAHESHHLGMRGQRLAVANPTDSLAFAVVNLCVAEGAANEFISGPPPGLAPSVPNVPFRVFTPPLAAAWTARVAEEPEMMARLTGLLDRATHGTLSGDQLEAEMRDYWFNGVIGRAYVLGSDLLAAIYWGLGRDAVIAAIEDPRQMFQLYDRALDRDPGRLGRCVRVPDTAVAQALAIGRR